MNGVTQELSELPAAPLESSAHGNFWETNAAVLAAAASAVPRADVWFTFDAPRVALEELFALPEALGLWANPNHAADGSGDAFVALGVAERFSAEGSERFVRIRSLAEQRMQELQAVSLPGIVPLAPRVFGGFAFQVQRSGALPWTNFGEADFVLPRMAYCHRAGGAALSVLLPRGEAARRVALSEALSLLDKLEVHCAVERASLSIPSPLAVLTQPLTDPATPVLGAHASEPPNHTARAEWSALVEQALEQIRVGSLTKVVVARRRTVQLGSPISVANTLAALRDTHTTSTRFAFRRGPATFLGATPERLLYKRGLQFFTEALAGTFRRSQSDFAAELLRSPKEHEEHQPVLDAILERLAPHAEHLEYRPNPELRELPSLLHLRTPISGRLRAPKHILELVADLHPTPAVGGVPTAEALHWIAEHERHERGWYAGPIGWFDAAGDGEFMVALRSGVVEGNTVTAFAGAGIVQGSDPESEFAETELKFTALLDALRH